MEIQNLNDKVIAELSAELLDISEALECDRMSQTQYDDEHDALFAYALIANQTGATIAEIRKATHKVGRSTNERLSIDERERHGWISPDEAQDLRVSEMYFYASRRELENRTNERRIAERHSASYINAPL